MTNYPAGVSSFGMPVIPSQIEQARSGRVYWVSNNTVVPRSSVKTGANNPFPQGGTFEKPFATLAYALTQTRANAGDTIVIKEGHAESLAAATDLDATVATAAGVAVVGLGTGTKRPTYTFAEVGSTINVAVANLEFRNLLFVPAAAVTSAFTCATATQNMRLVNMEFTSPSTSNFLNIVTTGAANTADGLYINGCVWNSNDVGCLAFVVNAAAQDGITIMNTRVQTSGTVATLMSCGANNVTNLFVADCYTRNLLLTASGAAGIVVSCSGTASTGLIVRVYAECSDASGSVIIPAASKVTVGGCFLSGVPGEYMTAGPAGAAAIGTQFNNT